MSIPSTVGHVDEVKLCEEARWLVGFWLNKGSASPCKTPSAWARSGIRPNSYWGDSIKERIASQVSLIRHWRVFHGSYTDIPDVRATWYVDPPYQKAGKHYRHSVIDYQHLSRWCQGRSGQTIVCENAGADWLPFSAIGSIKATPGKRRSGESLEVIWTQVK
jgi:hypothetical protein